MSYRDAERLRDLLAEGGVDLQAEPRGFGKKRGVPDSVLWLRPETLSIYRTIPILVELEGRMFNADDFEKFARRNSEDEPYQHHIDLPILDTNAPSFQTNLPYELVAAGIGALTSRDHLTEPQCHDEIRRWAEEYEDSFQTDARITVREGTRLVWWQIKFAMFGHSFTTQVPFVVDAGETLTEILRLQADRIIIPSVGILNDEAGVRSNGRQSYSTAIRFDRFSSAQLLGNS